MKNDVKYEEHSEITLDDTLEEISRKTINSNIFAINETMSLLDNENFGHCVATWFQRKAIGRWIAFI
jgi:DNA-binding MurR/RpiR family transcriptional regulator